MGAASLASILRSPVMSSCTLILKSFSVGSIRVDSAPEASCNRFMVSSSPNCDSGSTASVYQRLNAWVRR